MSENTTTTSVSWGDLMDKELENTESIEIEDEKMVDTMPEPSSDRIQAEEVKSEEQKNAPQEREERGPRQYQNHYRGPPPPRYPYHGPPRPPHPNRGPPPPPNNRPSYQPYRGPPGPPHHGPPNQQHGPPRPPLQGHDRPPWMRDIESLKSKLRDRTGKLKEVSLELKDVSSKLEEEKQSKAKLQTENNQKDKKINDLLEAVKAENNRRMESEKQIRMLKEQLKHLNPSFTEVNFGLYPYKTKEELIGVIEAQNKKLQDKASGVSHHEKTLRAQIEVLEQETRTLRARNEVLEQRNKTMPEKASKKEAMQLKALKDQLELQRDQIKAQEKAQQDKDREIKDLRMQLENSRPASRAPEQESADPGKIQELLDLVSSQNNQLKDEVSRSDSLQREVQEVRQRLSAEIDSLKEDICVLQREASRKDTDSSLQIESLTNQLQVQTSYIRDLESKLQTEQGNMHLKALKGQLELQHDQIKAQEKAQQDKEREIEDLRMQLENSRPASRAPEQESADSGKIQELLDLVSSQNDRLKDEVSRSGSQQREAQEVRQRLSAEIDSLKKDIWVLQRDASRKDTDSFLQIESLTNQLQEQTSYVSDLEFKLQTEQGNIQVLQKDIEYGRDVIASKTSHLQAETLRADTLTNQLQDVRLQLSEAEDRLQMLEQKMNEEASSRDAVNERLESLEDELEEKTNCCIVLLREVPGLLREVGENVSLWREFRKALTPSCWRQYKMDKIMENLRRLATLCPPPPPDSERL